VSAPGQPVFAPGNPWDGSFGGLISHLVVPFGCKIQLGLGQCDLTWTIPEQYYIL